MSVPLDTFGSRKAAVAAGLVAALVLAPADAVMSAPKENSSCLSPTALVATKDGKTLLIACAAANRIMRLELQARTATPFLDMPGPPSGLALSA